MLIHWIFDENEAELNSVGVYGRWELSILYE